METRKPLIGVTPQWDAEQQRMWMRPNYMDRLWEQGAIPVLLPVAPTEEDARQLMETLDGLLLSGGPDVAPELFGEEPVEGAPINYCEIRERTDLAYFRAAETLGKPVLGICLGEQIINIALGGTLWQDIPLQHPEHPCHRQPEPYSVPFHDVILPEGTPLAQLSGAGRIAVNSCHHQAVKDLAPGLKAMAIAPDGVIEALYRPEGGFAWGIQWHPEDLSGKVNEAVFAEFVKAVKEQL